MVGKIDDPILTKRLVTYAIVGAGGFLGLGRHDVAIPADKLMRDNDRIVLPNASKDSVPCRASNTRRSEIDHGMRHTCKLWRDQILCLPTSARISFRVARVQWSCVRSGRAAKSRLGLRSLREHDRGPR